MTDTPLTNTPSPVTDVPVVPNNSSLPGEKTAMPPMAGSAPVTPVLADEPDTFTNTPAAPSLGPKPATPTTPAVAPLVVTEAEVKDDASEHQKLAEEIEILTGEIQALEAKIERLTAGATSSPNLPVAPVVSPSPTSSALSEMNADIPRVSEPTPPPMPVVKLDLPEISKPVSEPVAPNPSADEPPAAPKPLSTPVPVNHTALNISDIYPKKDDSRTATMPSMPTAPVQAGAEESPSALGMIGEIVGIIGVVLFVLMLLSPLYKDMLDVTLWETVRTFGWLSAVVALLVGFVFSLFNHGKWGMKIFLLIVLLLAGLLYYSISNPGSFLDAALGSILSFYQ